MFIGHFAVGFGAKKAVPKVSLGTLFLAGMLLDLIFPVLALTGVERVRIVPGITAVSPLDLEFYPYSHSLLFSCLWAAGLAVLYGIFKGWDRRALWLGALVVSHWVLDVISHRPDMPLYPGSPLIGLGLWNSRLATLGVEGGLFALGIWLYVRTTRARDGIGRFGLWGLVGLLSLLYLASLNGVPPPSVNAMAVVGGLGASLFIAAGYWIDRHREAKN